MASFRPLTPTVARWRSWEGDGLEQVALRPTRTGAAMSSVVVGNRNGNDYGVSYAIACARDWRVTRLDLETVAGERVEIRSPRKGVWLDGEGNRLTEFDGCDGVDLEGSPITNMLALRLLGLKDDDEPVELRILYVPFDNFRPFVDEQRYHCLREGKRYRYEAVDGSFESEIEVDADGLVVSYPPLFRRVPLSS